MTPQENSRPRTRADYERGLPGYHDPTAGFGGAAPARSALTLRAVLAGFGLGVLHRGRRDRVQGRSGGAGGGPRDAGVDRAD